MFAWQCLAARLVQRRAGAGPKYFYLFALGVRAYLARDVRTSRVIACARWGLLIMLGASLIMMVLNPDTLTYNEELTRASFITVRLWGLGSNPNSIAALGADAHGAPRPAPGVRQHHPHADRHRCGRGRGAARAITDRLDRRGRGAAVAC
ncbi:MAG: hypothetical protein R3E83_11220 [Burkholderiaceae bacterium]